MVTSSILPVYRLRTATVPYRAQYGSTVDAVALAVVMRQPFQPMVLSGAASVEHLESNWATQLAGRMEEADVAALMAASVQGSDEYWAQRAALEWN